MTAPTDPRKPLATVTRDGDPENTGYYFVLAIADVVVRRDDYEVLQELADEVNGRTAPTDSVSIPPALDGREATDRHPERTLSRDEFREIAGRAWDRSDEDLTLAQDEGGDRASIPAILAERDAAECLEDRAALYAAAPDLLRALAGLVPRFDPYSMPECGAHEALAVATEAIRKAGIR